jgi:type I restriction enzyme M protein
MAKSPKAVKALTLEQVLWNCRVVLRNKCNKPDNRDAVLALIFLKFAGDKFEKRRNEIIAEKGKVPVFLEKPAFYLASNVFYLNETSRWPYIVKNASDDRIAVILDQAMADIEDKNESLKGALPQRFFSSLGVSGNDIKALVDEINKISEERFHEKDLIGRVYEYFLQQFAMDEAKEKGEFYTPKAIVNLIAELIEPYKGRIYDPCCGSGGMFVQSLKFVESHHGNKSEVSVYGQESDPDTYRLAKMNLAIRGISNNLGEKNASSFTDDLHKDLKVDFIMANPPFNLKNWRGANQLTVDPRWAGYGTPPVSNANYAWILHMLSKLDVTNGIAGFLLANGALGADSEEYNIRKQLIENDKIEAIIVLPREMFYSTDISVTLWILNNNKKAKTLNERALRDRRNEVLFIDLRTWNKNIYEKSYVTFDDAQIAAVKKIYNDWQGAGGGGGGTKNLPYGVKPPKKPK